MVFEKRTDSLGRDRYYRRCGGQRRPVAWAAIAQRIQAGLPTAIMKIAEFAKPSA